MDASYKIQRGIHVHLIQFFMCPEFWVHITGGPPLSITAGEGFHSGAERKTDSHGGCAGRLRLGHSGAVFPGAVRGDRSLPPGLDGAPVASGSAPAVPCGTEAGDGAGFGPVRGQRRSACTPLPHMV